MTKQRNASKATIASYRDGLRLLILFAAERTQREPCALTVADLDRDLILAFLDNLETKRQNTIQTRNARLAAIRSFFRHVAENDPASLGIAQRILTIPLKKTHTEVTPHLTRQEFDALVEAPDQRTPRGRRDRSLLLFLGRTGGAHLRGTWRQPVRSSPQSGAAAGAPARQGARGARGARRRRFGQSADGADPRARPPTRRTTSRYSLASTASG